MRRFPTSTMRACWNDPFRLVLAISLLALAGWIIVQSGGPDEASSRVRADDVDLTDASPIFVTFDDATPFDMPIDETDGVIATRPGSARTTRPTSSRRTASTRGPNRSSGTSRPPTTDGGSTTPPPSTGGGTGTAPTTGGNGEAGAGSGPAAHPPATAPDNPASAGRPAVPAVDQVLPALPDPNLGTSTLHRVRAL